MAARSSRSDSDSDSGESVEAAAAPAFSLFGKPRPAGHKATTTSAGASGARATATAAAPSRKRGREAISSGRRSQSVDAQGQAGSGAGAAAGAGGATQGSDGDGSGSDTDGGASVVEEEEIRTFDGLGLSTWLVKACHNMGLARPTPVQQACVPAVLSGRDIMACSPTGSGKTAAFALPILEHLSRDPYGVFAVVLTAGRELAQQITDQFNAFGRPMRVRVATVIGGMDFTRQARELAAVPHIIVATPGRLADHIASGSTPLRLRRVKYVVVDEADRLLDASMAPDLDTIFGAMPPATQRHTLLYSATMTKNLERIEALAVHRPFKWSLEDNPTTVRQLAQFYLLVSRAAKMSYLAHIMRTQGPLAEETAESGGEITRRARSAIVFVSTRYSAQLLMETLTELGLHCVALHSAMSQRRRLAALGKFKSTVCKVMVATDVASRGLDIPQVELVVNFDVPRNPDDYIHRVGRTARAGRGGRAITFVSQYDIHLVLAIEKVTGVKLVQLPGVDEEAVLAAMGKVTTARQMAKLRLAETGFEQKIADDKARKQEQRQEQLAYLENKGEDDDSDGSGDSEPESPSDEEATTRATGATATPSTSRPTGKAQGSKSAGGGKHASRSRVAAAKHKALSARTPAAAPSGKAKAATTGKRRKRRRVRTSSSAGDK